MSAQANRNELPPAKRRRLLGLGLLRSLAAAVVLVALYYLLPLDHIRNVPLTLVAGLLTLLAVSVWQVRAIISARHPALRAVEALASTVPLFLLLFASAYFTMAGTNPASFSTHSLTRTDALYFTVTTFSTVGFGDITAVSQSARLVVTAQMLLDLLALGLGIRVFTGAVQLGSSRRTGPPIPISPQNSNNPTTTAEHARSAAKDARSKTSGRPLTVPLASLALVTGGTLRCR